MKYILVEHVQRLLNINSSGIDGSRLSLIDQLTKNDTISHGIEHVLRVGVDGQEFSTTGIVLQVEVDVLTISNNFLLRVRVMTLAALLLNFLYVR